MILKPPTSPPSSLAQTTQRLAAGMAGVYVKSDSAVLITTRTPDSNGVLPFVGNTPDQSGATIRSNFLSIYGVDYAYGGFFGFEVRLPEAASRIRVAFGVSKVASNNSTNREDGADLFEYVNVFPGMWFPNSKASSSSSAGTPDQSLVLNGQAIYPYPQLEGVDGNGRSTFHEGDFIYGGFDGTAANSGGRVSSNGKGIPFAYEAISKANVYRVRGGIFSSQSDRLTCVPIVGWASFEIVDPRSEEDTVALLNECKLVAPSQPKFFT